MLPVYQPGEAAAYCQRMGWVYRQSGDELLLDQCPFCYKKQKLYWNDVSGAFDCKSADCGRRGNYFTMRRDMGDPVMPQRAQPTKPPEVKKRITFQQFAKFEQALLNHPQAMQFLLEERGLTAETAKKWHLGLKVEGPDTHRIEDYPGDVYWLMIPYLTRQGDIANIKYRTLPFPVKAGDPPVPKRFKRWLGGESILFGEHLLPEKKQKCKQLFLVEGELDAITLDQHGFAVALSTTTGAASFSPRWYDLIVSSGAKEIFLIYDSDVDGRAGAEKLVKKFNDDERKVYDIVLEDAKDANEYFKAHTAEDFRQILEEARPSEMEYVLSPSAVLDRLEEQIFLSGNAFNGIPSQFSNLNELIDGGFGNGFLTTVIGGPGTGKTSWAIQELLHMGNQNMATYLCCLELPEEMVMRKVINHLYHTPLNKITQEHIQKYRSDIERRGMFIGRGPTGRNFEKRLDALANTFIKAIKRFDLKSLVLDNMHYFVRSRDNNEAELGMLSETLKGIGMECNIPILALGQPVKFNRSERIIDNSDVKGSGSIEQDSDAMVLMWRPTLKTKIEDFGKSMGHKENMSPLTLFRVAKSRYSPGGETLLYFHGEISTFRQLSDDETKRLMDQSTE